MNWKNITPDGVALEVGDILQEGDTYSPGYVVKPIPPKSIGCKILNNAMQYDYRRPLDLAGSIPADIIPAHKDDAEKLKTIDKILKRNLKPNKGMRGEE